MSPSAIQTSIVREVRGFPAIVHCSTVVQTGSGDLLTIWYEGRYETSSDTVLRFARSPSHAPDEWGEAKVLVDLRGVPVGNPVAWCDNSGRLQLVFSLLLGEAWTESILVRTTSEDDGHTWSVPHLFQPRKGFMAKTRPVMLADRSVVFPLYHETTYCPYAMVIRDADQPLQGELVAETMARGKAIQPAIATLSDGRLLMLSRTNRGSVWKSVSPNNGYSWTICRPTALGNPDSAVDLIRTAHGHLVLALNHSPTSRGALHLLCSDDDGESWFARLEVASGDGEYSYPSLMQSRDGSLILTYTEDRFRIRAVRVAEELLAARRLPKPLITDLLP